MPIANSLKLERNNSAYPSPHESPPLRKTTAILLRAFPWHTQAKHDIANHRVAFSTGTLVMLRSAMIALVAAALVVPQVASAGGGIHGFPHRGLDIVPWFLLDGATRLGVFPRWYVSDYYPYYIYRSVYPYYVDADFVVGCYPIRRPVLGVHGWRMRAAQVCD
jgi:hypothetical protein